MKNKFPLDCWSWSQERGEWVYAEKSKEGIIKLTYQIEPPEEFISLTKKLAEINKKLIAAEDPDEKNRIFRKLMDISEKMNSMKKEC
ncbi:MAG: hypothetical protein GF317_08730 [Candidatus Lokiarchaeota archaeon]|nr:hypothetical protein [Candidatus Lokiarchaeota archaeon]MBD3199802.1 hypothetical protein [Candidatus Lokiarchaeota archaeon]